MYHSMYGAEHKLEKQNENHGLNHELFILLHTQSIVCATVLGQFRVLGIHNFALTPF